MPGDEQQRQHARIPLYLNNLSGAFTAPSSAVTGTTHTGANWLVTWRWNNDLWFAQATVNIAGSLTCLAGRPLSVYNDGEPKAVEYVNNANATPISGAACSTSGNNIEIDVPESAIGGVGTASDATNHELYGLTGWTGEEAATLPVSVCASDGLNPTLDTCTSQDPTNNTSIGFFDNADETAPLDVLLANPESVTPEVPSVPLLIGLGAAAILAGGWIRTRRRRQFGEAAAAP